MSWFGAVFVCAAIFTMFDLVIDMIQALRGKLDCSKFETAAVYFLAIIGVLVVAGGYCHKYMSVIIHGSEVSFPSEYKRHGNAVEYNYKGKNYIVTFKEK